MFTWRRFWLTLGAVVGIGIGVAGFVDGARGPVVAGAIFMGLGVLSVYWLVASFTDKVPKLVLDEAGVVYVPLSRTNGIMGNIGLLGLAFAISGVQLVTPEGAISVIVSAVLGIVALVFVAYAFMGLFSAAKGPAAIELTPQALKVRHTIPWHAAWSDIESVNIEPFAGTPSLAIRFKAAAFVRQLPQGWCHPPSAPVPLWLPTDHTKADKEALSHLVIDYWKRSQDQ